MGRQRQAAQKKAEQSATAESADSPTAIGRELEGLRLAVHGITERLGKPLEDRVGANLGVESSVAGVLVAVEALKRAASHIREAEVALRPAPAIGAATSGVKKPERDDSLPARLVRWCSLTPTVVERFAAVMNLFLDQPVGTAIPLAELTERLGWSPELVGSDKFQDTRKKLARFSGVNLLEVSTGGRNEDGSRAYTLTKSAREFVASGIFTSLGVPPRT